jgi:hypothetical protein
MTALEFLLTRLKTTTAELKALDDAELLDGYTDGRNNDPMPGPNRSDSYVHGWWNGMRDGGHRNPHSIDGQIVAAGKPILASLRLK